MTTEVDFALTLQLAGSFFASAVGLVSSLFEKKRYRQKRKKGICQFVDFLSCLLDRHPRGELGPRDKTPTGGCYKLGMGELRVWGVWEGSVPYSHIFGGSPYQTRNLLSGVRGC